MKKNFKNSYTTTPKKHEEGSPRALSRSGLDAGVGNWTFSKEND